MVIVNVLIVFALFIGLYTLEKKQVSFGKRILIALFAGILLGTGYQFAYGSGSSVIRDTISWLNIPANGYIRLLKLIVTPLVLTSIISSILQLKDLRSFRTTGLLIVGILLFTTVIAASIGAGSAAFGAARARRSSSAASPRAAPSSSPTSWTRRSSSRRSATSPSTAAT